MRCSTCISAIFFFLLLTTSIYFGVNSHSYHHLSGVEEQASELPFSRNVAGGPASPTSQGGVWPLPQKIHYGLQNRTLRRNSIMFVFKGVRDVDCDILNFAKKTYLKEWFFPTKFPTASTGQLTVVIHLHKKCPKIDEFPQQDMDEEYRLRVPFTGDVTLDAQEVWGILRGLETLSHLIFQVKGAFFMRTATIHDWPEYSFRGVLLDTSRHYLRKNLILRQIDLMAQNKMNVLHWHIVDMESFPYVSKQFPNLDKAGSFTPKHVYTRNTVDEIIKYARLRGIRIMVEFDTPGHMTAWAGQSQLMAECRNGSQVTEAAMIDPSIEDNYVFLEKFFKEVLETFPEKFIHLGGDETEYWINFCWEQNPKIKKFMERKKIQNITMLENYYYSRLQAIITELGGSDPSRRMAFWEEVFEKNNPDPKSVVHVWKSSDPLGIATLIAQATKAGHQVLLSGGWYLNYISYGDDWKHYYKLNPRDFPGTYEQKQLVLGGVAAVWGEYIDGTNLESTLWPRASAVAERLWSPEDSTKSEIAAWPRLHEHRCRMIARGFKATPVNGAGDYCLVEWDDPV